MKFWRAVLLGGIVVATAAAELSAAGADAANHAVSSPPVYVPDMSHANGPLPDGFLAWNSLMEATNVPAGQPQAHFVFSFTNIAETVDRAWKTNVTALARVVATTNSGFWRTRVSYVTNFTTITNVGWVTNSITPIPVTITDVHPSCGCTTAQLPRRPWTIPPGSNGEFGLTVNLGSMTGTLFKSVAVSTDKGSKTLYMQITIRPPVIPHLTDAERAHDLEIAKADRQAVFKPECATCHANSVQGKYGKPLYDAVCAICHDADNRAAIVPDLHNLKVPTNSDFWRTWIAQGKPGSLMPAFSSTEGGPLTDMQIATLAAYLSYSIPSHVPTGQ